MTASLTGCAGGSTSGSLSSTRRSPFFWSLVATAETLIALALIFGFARKVTYIAAIVFSLLIWSTAAGFGGPYTSGASDIGTAIIYVVVFAGLLALSYYAGPARYSADYYLEKKISWWWRVAELRRPLPAVPVPDAAVPIGAVPAPAVPADDAPTGQPHAARQGSHQSRSGTSIQKERRS